MTGSVHGTNYFEHESGVGIALVDFFFLHLDPLILNEEKAQ